MRIDVAVHGSDPGLSGLRHAWRNAGERCALAPAELSEQARAQARAVLATELPGAVRERLQYVEEVADFVADRLWSARPVPARDFAAALAYLLDPADLIPDDAPRYGYLDDALVLEMALREHRHEWLSWRRYRAFRARLGADASFTRAEWLRVQREHRRAERAASSYLDAAAEDGFGRETHSYVESSGLPERFVIQ